MYFSIKQKLAELQYSQLVINETRAEQSLYMSVTRQQQHIDSEIGPIPSPRLLFKFEIDECTGGMSVYYCFQVLLKALEAGSYDEQAVMKWLNRLIDGSTYVTCPGIFINPPTR